MKIESYQIEMESKRDVTFQKQRETKLKVWDNRKGTSSNNNSAFSLQISQKGFDQNINKIDQDHSQLPPKLNLMKMVLEKFFGIKIKIINPEKDEPEPAAETKTGDVEEQRQGWGIEIKHTETTLESEKINFTTEGIIRNQAGKEFQIKLTLEMSKTSISQNHFEFKAGDALIDPLIIDYSNNGIDLLNTTTKFDLNSDGTMDNINLIKQGSGFLALDKNHNGTIDSGKELFGPETNNGFYELSQYDSDQNNWIDENDPVFYDLKIFRPEENHQNLQNLKTLNIGSIYLGNQNTEFNLDNGQIKKTGIFLSERGFAGVIQEINFKA